MPRTKSAHDLSVHDKVYWNGKDLVSYALPSKKESVPVAMLRTKSAHDLSVHDKVYWDGKALVAHALPSKKESETTSDVGSISDTLNIDEVPVLDDPRQWSQRRKVSG